MGRMAVHSYRIQVLVDHNTMARMLRLSSHLKNSGALAPSSESELGRQLIVAALIDAEKFYGLPQTMSPEDEARFLESRAQHNTKPR